MGQEATSLQLSLGSSQDGKEPWPLPTNICVPSGAAKATRQQAKLFPHGMNGRTGGRGANTPPRHFQQLAPGSPKRPRAVNMLGRGAGLSRRSMVAAHTEQCWEGEKKSIPTDTGTFSSQAAHRFLPRGGQPGPEDPM